MSLRKVYKKCICIGLNKQQPKVCQTGQEVPRFKFGARWRSPTTQKIWTDGGCEIRAESAKSGSSGAREPGREQRPVTWEPHVSLPGPMDSQSPLRQVLGQGTCLLSQQAMFHLVFLQVSFAGLIEVRLRFPSIAFRAIAFPCNQEFVDRFALSRPSFAMV